MANLSGFDASVVEPSCSLDPVPAGKYEALITESDFRETKSGSGQYLQLTFQVVGGEYEGRLLWSRLNLVNPNPQAVQIAQAELSAICRAVGVMAPTDSSDLHDRPLMIKVVCKKREDTGDIINEIKGYMPRESEVVSSSDTPPWGRA